VLFDRATDAQGGWLVGKEIKVEIDIAAVDQVEQIAEQEAAEPAA
jgi:hypothetical protein